MRAVGIILAGGNNNRMRELTQKTCSGAMPIAGSSAALTLLLSNMTNSHVQTVAVLTQYNSRSLNEHLILQNGGILEETGRSVCVYTDRLRQKTDTGIVARQTPFIRILIS